MTKMKITKWTNCDNHDFYKTIGPDNLYNFSQKAGLTAGCDIDVSKDYWCNAKTVLEVGAGYGRVIDTLLRMDFKGSITTSFITYSQLIFCVISEYIL